MFVLFLSVFFFLHANGSDVISLKESTFHELNEHEISLVKYYAPWCGHCKQLAPEFEKAASKLKKNKYPVFLAEVDCTTESSLCSDVKGYPTMKIYHNGEKPEDYNGPRTADGIVNEMRNLAGPAFTEFNTIEELEKLIESDIPVAVAQSMKETPFSEVFSTCAKSLRSNMLFLRTDKKIIDSSKDTVLKLYLPNILRSKLEGDSKLYDGDFEFADVKVWLKKNAYGDVGLRDRNNIEFFESYPLLVAYSSIDTERDISGFKYLRNRILKVATSSAEQMKFAVSDSSIFAHELSDLGFDENTKRKTPIVAILSEKSQKFLMEDDFSVDSLKNFISRYIDGKIEPFIKSEPIPMEKDGHVTKVVAKNFEEVVLDPSKDVLVEFYAPWCGHCKELKPKYDALAEKLSGETDVVIAAMDATANTLLPSFPVTGFPTIFFVPKSSKSKPVPYEGGRETDDMIKFIAKSSSSELKGYDRSGNSKKSEL